MSKFLGSLLVFGAVAALAVGQGVGPDVIVGDLHEVANYSHLGNIDAFSVGTTSCNVGNVNLNWFSQTNQHPVIGQTAYRISGNRCEMIGQSWLKHGFFALSQTLCGTCPNPTSGTQLGVGCSDPYSAGLNGNQSNLGPKFEVDAYTGSYPFPAFMLTATGNSIFKRLQIHTTDLDPANFPNATYVVEGQYVTPDDASAGNGFNNASWREVVFTPAGGGYDIALAPGSTTHQQQPAIFAWQFYDPSVQIETVDLPGEGRFHVALKVIDNGDGTKTYEYAVHNLNSHVSAQSFNINLQPNSTITGLYFHDVDYHSGEPYNLLDWQVTQGATTLSWATTPFVNDQNANALRWGTTYNFAFTTDKEPLGGTLGLFRPFTQPTVPFTVGAAPITATLAAQPPTEINAGVAYDVDLQVTPNAGVPDPSGMLLHYAVDGGAFQSQVMADQGGGLFRGTLPAVAPYSRIDWYVSAVALGGGGSLTIPSGAPGNIFTSLAYADLVTVFADDFETDKGWTVLNGATLTSGAWQRGLPNGLGQFGEPATDFDGSGKAYLTGLAVGADVDGGFTTLTSPAFDLGFSADALIEFAFWLDTTSGPNPGQDPFVIELSNDDGATWVVVETTTQSASNWQTRTIRLSDFLFASNAVRIRFTASDFFSDAIVEAGVDAVRVRALPVLVEPHASGNVGASAGGPFDVLKINNSAGGPLRFVGASVGSPFTLQMDPVPTTANPVFFAVFGTLFFPMPTDLYTLPGIGTMNVSPCFAAPNNPNLFLLTNNFPISLGCQQLMGSTVTPWAATIPASFIPFPIAFTLQGIIIDPSSPTQLSVTNAITLDIR